MTVITIDAVVSNGGLKPTTPLDLPEGTKVQAHIFVPTPEAPAADPLFGAFPQLSTLGDDDFVWAKELWAQGVERQIHKLNDSSKA